ncbi:RNA polymerase sigma factor [Nocardia mangyaensis]|uniref:RNA polymerase sigma factor n=1 Tax=Nocardia mangyaensis TaxID=2213200 RepID=UPI0026754B60|nr:sigma-70 family RNA polymerase sigma factor [Nocardia mangyaensis]MDO3645835.1 sigma-70 family RNA polymerase sigma factor [Nocardia mangyaensis]
MVGQSPIPADDELVERLRDGDESAFAVILGAWSGSMLRLAMSFVSTPASAEEVVQDTWLAVIRGIDGFEGRSALKTWVFRILVNTAKKRGIKEHRTVPFGSLLPEDSGPTVDPDRFRPADDPHPGHWRPGEKPRRWSEPEDAAEREELATVLAAAIAQLPARSRVVLTLRDAEGYTCEEVCALLEITPGNQRVILHRARAAVRAQLEPYFRTITGDVTPES